MQQLSIKELLEKIRDDEYRRQESLLEETAYENRELNLGECYTKMKKWRSNFFRTNSRNKATMRIICRFEILDGVLWQQFSLQLFLQKAKGKDGLQESFRIRHEAFDVLVRGIESSLLQKGLESYTLETFTPKLK